MLLPAPDASPADWIVDRWSPAFVGQLVPFGFEACVRVSHPAEVEGAL